MSFATSDYRLDAIAGGIQLSRGFVQVANKRYWHSPQETLCQGADDMSHPKPIVTETDQPYPTPDKEHVGWTADYRLIHTREPGGREVYRLQRLRMIMRDGELPEPEWVTIPTVEVPYTPEPTVPTRGPQYDAL